MAITIKDIAAEAGVSRGTVDRVLHKRPGVNQEVTERVWKITRELGYSTNKAGRLLAANKKPITIGVLLPSIGNPFFKEIIRGLQDVEKENSDYGLSLDIRNIKGYDIHLHCQTIDALVESGAQALLIVSPQAQEINDKIKELALKGIPVACVNTNLPKSERLFYVGPNYYQSGCTSAGILNLITKEDQKILIITGSFNIVGHNKRIEGFLDTLRAKGLHTKIVGTEESLDDDQRAYEISKALLIKHPDITTVFIAAAGVEGTCKAIKEIRGTKKPIVLSFDKIESTARLLKEGLIDATICQEPYRQGYEAGTKMFNYMVVDKKMGNVEDTIVNTVLLIKENL